MKETKAVVKNEIPKAYQNGYLINLRVRKWGATTKADEDRFGDEFPKEIFRAVQDLLDEEGRDMLSALNGVKNSCNATLLGMTIQFPIHGFRFLKENQEANRLTVLSETVEEHRTTFFNLVEVFLSKYEDLKKQYKEKFPKDYKEWKYPTEAKLRNAFDFTLQLFEFNGPGEALKTINPAVYKQQMDEIKRNCDEMGQMVVKVFCSALMERMNVLVEQCGGKGNIGNRTIGSITNLLDKFNDLYIDFVDDKKIKGFTSDIKEYLEDVDSDLLKADDNFRNLIGKKAKEVSDTIKKMNIVDKPSRKIDL